MSFAKLALVAVIGLGLTACQDAGTKQGVGSVLGGVGGAVAGAQFGSGKGQLAATAAGALLGALLGSEVGKSLDRADQAAMSQTTNRTLESAPTGQAASWRNPDSGNSGTVTPTRTYQRSGGEYCREYTQTVRVGGKTEEAYGTACRQPDGTWKTSS
jgi:surface antigen